MQVYLFKTLLERFSSSGIQLSHHTYLNKKLFTVLKNLIKSYFPSSRNRDMKIFRIFFLDISTKLLSLPSTWQFYVLYFVTLSMLFNTIMSHVILYPQLQNSSDVSSSNIIMAGKIFLNIVKNRCGKSFLRMKAISIQSLCGRKEAPLASVWVCYSSLGMCAAWVAWELFHKWRKDVTIFIRENLKKPLVLSLLRQPFRCNAQSHSTAFTSQA